MTTRYRATLAYDGTAYQGFQRQTAGTPTVQGALEDALSRITGQNVSLVGAGRTDSGVHAEGQVVAFDVVWNHDDDDLLRAVNANLPDDIALQNVTQQPGFHPRYDATARLYRYTVLVCVARQPAMRHSAWQMREALNVTAMQAAAANLVGERDFAALGTPPQGDNTVRRVMRSEWQTVMSRYGTLHSYHIEANAFLYHMVRRTVGLLVDVGRGRLSVNEAAEVVNSADIRRAKTLAPAHGLTLEAVFYED